LTTIAFKRYLNHIEAACDSFCVNGGMVYEVQKFLVSGDRLILAAGNLADLHQLNSWLERGARIGDIHPTSEESEALIFYCGAVFDVSCQDQWLCPSPLLFDARGSGFGVAKGAMLAGYSPSQAIKAIRDSRQDVFTGGEIHRFWIDADGVEKLPSW